MSNVTMTRSTARDIESVYRKEGPRLWRALYASTRDRELASDSLGEAFAQALARGEAINDLAAWVWRVAFAVARGELKNREWLAGPPLDLSYEHSEPIPYVLTALAALPTNQRLSVVLHDYADLPTREVAAILGTAPSTVYVHLSRGRRKLRELLEEKNEEVG